MRIHRSTLVGAAGAAVLLALGSTATANAGGGGSTSGSGGSRTEVVEVEDDCHPPTFNEAIFPGACDPAFDGDTTAAEFFAEIAEEGEAGKWRFHPDDTEVDAGTRLRVVNVGGEFHTFTPVEHFGGGCIPDPRLDIGEAPVPGCVGFDPATHEFGVLPGGRLIVVPTAHRELYQCLIHPWMRAVVEVDDDHSGHH